MKTGYSLHGKRAIVHRTGSISDLGRQFRPDAKRTGRQGKKSGWCTLGHCFAILLQVKQVGLKGTQKLPARQRVAGWTIMSKEILMLNNSPLIAPWHLCSGQPPHGQGLLPWKAFRRNLSFVTVSGADFDSTGGPDRDRTDDLFHAMEARSQLRHRPTQAPGRSKFYSARRG